MHILNCAPSSRGPIYSPLSRILASKIIFVCCVLHSPIAYTARPFVERMARGLTEFPPRFTGQWDDCLSAGFTLVTFFHLFPHPRDSSSGRLVPSSLYFPPERKQCLAISKFSRSFPSCSREGNDPREIKESDIHGSNRFPSSHDPRAKIPPGISAKMAFE